MIIKKQIPLLDGILEKYQGIIGDEYLGYKNHVYRMVHFCQTLKKCNEDESKKIIIAGAFHDIGIWTDNTFDYLSPSISQAMKYLKKNNLEYWSDEIRLMISEHHKISEYNNKKYALVEIFRQGDLIDFSYGFFKFGIPKSYIKSVKATFNNAGFHKNIGKRAVKWFIKNPLKPAPMMKL
ncbi:MAG: hypothetical protein DRQ51_10280 [Gammaproteobacteria bacterium]|nr:MAG: hypothetical protein DRQ51_10280 [Gammaproteobacteria bacterium]